VEANSTGGQGSRRAVAPNDDDDECTAEELGSKTFNKLLSQFNVEGWQQISLSWN
jgi:hypothetical protein